MRSEQLISYYIRAAKFLDGLHDYGPLIEYQPMKARYSCSAEPVPFAGRLDADYKEIKTGEMWGNMWDSAWFHLTGTIPDEWKNKKVVARLNFNGEACVFDNAGCPLCGLTNGSVFDQNYGKDIYYLPQKTINNGKVEIWVEAAASGFIGIKLDKDPDPDSPDRYGSHEGKVVAMELALFDDDVWGLMLDFQVLFSLFDSLNSGAPSKESASPGRFEIEKILPEMTPRLRKILFGLNRAIDIYADNYRHAAQAREILQPLFSTSANDSDSTALAIGHAHLDTGWLWPVRESIRKCARTFSSQIALMEKYPDYVFGASQPQHYLFVKEHYPALYEKIKQFVRKGNWELQGGMWVEADCNIISGESMVRQFLHGKNFFKDEFGVEVDNLWLPDVFGYSAAMPQILKKAGVDCFITLKISWNQFNQFPHNTFLWRGIDGSKVLAHLPPEEDCNSLMLPHGQVKAQRSFKESHVINEFMSLYGIGDGGCGPKEEHVERALRMKDLEGCPKVRFGRADDLFERLLAKSDELEVWDGELYLERHRGTLTTQARSKKYNRVLERKLREVEFLYSALPLSEYPAAELDALWKTLLLNQFHDILPGSSIKKVHETSEQEYADSIAECDRLVAEVSAYLENDGKSLTLVNSLSTAFHGPVELPPSWHGMALTNADGEKVPVHSDSESTTALVNIPACSTLTLRRAGPAEEPETGSCKVLENDLIRYEFGPDADLLSVFDKELGREMLRGDNKGNQFALYVDRPERYDAWDVDITYENELLENARGIEVSPLGDGEVRCGLNFTLNIGASEIKQNIYLYSNSKRLEFHTMVDWNEKHRMLRVSFPVDVERPAATCDIQFGFIERPTHRNTSWDMAKFEVAAHKYVDISNEDFGVALINDCKYGHKINDAVIDLNLLRSPTHPDPDADEGVHSFRYALLPHQGPLHGSGVIEEAEHFNFPPILLNGVDADKFKLPVKIDGKGVRLAALKKAEKEDCLVIRLVESHGRHSSCQLTLPDKAKLQPCDLMEWESESLMDGKSHDLHFSPFEIKTFKIEP